MTHHYTGCSCQQTWGAGKMGEGYLALLLLSGALNSSMSYNFSGHRTPHALGCWIQTRARLLRESQSCWRDLPPALVIARACCHSVSQVSYDPEMTTVAVAERAASPMLRV